MIRTLLTTTAMTVLLSTGAYAQATTTEVAPATEAAPADAMSTDSTETPMATDSMAPAPAATDSMAPAPADSMAPAPMATDSMSTMDRSPLDMSVGYTNGDGDVVASAVLGAPIYSSANEDAAEIGTINDLVLSADGDILAVVIGVGGFLGIGEKNVAVDFSELEWTIAFDDTERWVIPTTAEALGAAPDFIWEDPNAAMDHAMAPADGMAPVDPAMAPAAPAQ